MPSSSPKLQTLPELIRLQRLTGSAIMRTLGRDDRMQTTWKDGHETGAVVGKFIKPNDRLTSYERLEIYNRQYWFRLIDSIYEDFPGLLAILGQTKFSKLARAYLAKYPSRSFTLRNLSRHMAQFLIEEPQWANPYQEMATDMARFEWAQVVAFDEGALRPIATEDLAGRDPKKLRLRLQPYITLLELAYPLDEYSLAIKKQAFRSEASNAMEEEDQSGKKSRVPRPRRRKTFVAVHRHENDLYYKKLTPVSFQLLESLAAGKTLAKACEAIAAKSEPEEIGRWFAGWAELGWFCKSL